MAEKVAGLRSFSDAAGKMNLGLDEVNGRGAGHQPVHAVRRFLQGSPVLRSSDAARPETHSLIQRFIAALHTAARGGHRASSGPTAGEIHRRHRDPHSWTGHDPERSRSLHRPPRRRQLLEMLGIPVRVGRPNIP